MSVLPSEIAQWKIERLVIANLPEDYRHARLEEITKNSILIENAVRLPVFGRQCRLYARRSRLIEEGDKFSDAGRAEEVPAVAPLVEMPAALKDEAEVKEEEVSVKDGGAAKRDEIIKEDNDEHELRKESTESLLCEKILSAINENYGDENILEQGSPSPIKKSKAEHQRLVAKLKYQLPDGWEKPYDKNSILELPANEQKENHKQVQTWNRLAKKDRGPVRPVPLSNHEVKRKFKERQTHAPSEAGVRPKNYVLDDMIAKLKDYQHLLTNDDLKKLAELEGEINLETPLDFGIFLAELKNKFNERYKSGYLNSIGVTLPYKSRRHEMGGAIENDEWPAFFKKLERIAQRVKRKRRRIIAARKKRGKVLYPRKYIYKPPRRPDVSKC